MTPQPQEWPQELQTAAWERSQKATPGPWKLRGDWRPGGLMQITPNDGSAPHVKADAEFVSGARTDLPAAIQHIAWQDARIAGLECNYVEVRAASREFLSDQQNTENPTTIEKIRFNGRRIKAQAAEIERLRAALSKYQNMEDSEHLLDLEDALTPAPSVPTSGGAKRSRYFVDLVIDPSTGEPSPAQAAGPEEVAG